MGISRLFKKPKRRTIEPTPEVTSPTEVDSSGENISSAGRTERRKRKKRFTRSDTLLTNTPGAAGSEQREKTLLGL